MALSTLVLKPSVYQSFFLKSHLSFAQADLLEFDQLLLTAAGGGSDGECGR